MAAAFGGLRGVFAQASVANELVWEVELEGGGASCSYPTVPASLGREKRRFCAVTAKSPGTASERRPGPSPFTEKYHQPRTMGGGRPSLSDVSIGGLPNPHPLADGTFSGQPPAEERDAANDVAERLPELREVLDMLRRKKAERGEKRGEDASSERGPGNVFLVGTGPGDPELLTLKAVRLMQTADLVLYDRLVSNDILDLIHPNARLLYVGKTSGYHSRTQDEIHELLLSFADAGATVLRLKGGDPLVFGRGGEEMDFLQEQGIHVQIVPGITSASGIAADLGIPLTHRGIANSVRFLTGHSRKGGEDPLYVASHAADPDSTLVIYMGLATLPGLVSRLTANGLSPETPACAVERGTTPQQRTIFAPLSMLPASVEEAGLVSPTLIIIGEVVSLAHSWPFEKDGREKGEVALEGQKEPRKRSLRSSDPALPSQRLGK